MSEEISNLIAITYLNPLSPVAFGSIRNVYNFFKDDASLDEVKKSLKKVKIYTVNRLRRSQKIYNPFFVYFPREVFQMDLADLSGISRQNEGVKFLLCIIDSATRFAWCLPLKNKSASVVCEKFEEFLSSLDSKPKRVHSDLGSEFLSAQFQDILKKNAIKQSFPQTSIHAPTVERFIRTLKNLIFKLMQSKKTNKYITELPDIMNIYNRRVHSSLKTLSPLEAEKKENRSKLIAALMENYEKNFIRSKKKASNTSISVGSSVRILKDKTPFQKGYRGQYSEETFVVAEKKENLHLPLFVLRKKGEDGAVGETLKYKFYEDELQSVEADFCKSDVPKHEVVERRTRRGIKESFVRWTNFRKKYDGWIPDRLLSWERV